MANILIVEDESIVGLDIQQRLQRLGYEVLKVVSNGRDAIAAAQTLNPDLVLMDITLRGDMDGLQAADSINTQFSIPVIFLTAYSDDHTLARAKRTQAYGYVLKPIKSRELYATIEMALCRHQDEQRLKQAYDQLEQRVQERTAELVRVNEELRSQIEERKQTEKTLWETQELLQIAVDQSPLGILIADAPEVRIRIANRAALGMRGGCAAQLTNIPVEEHARKWQTFYPDGRPVPAEELPLSRAVLKGEVSHNEELIIRHENGDRHWVLANAAPVRDADGAMRAGMVIFHDITERKSAEEEKARLQEQFQQAQKMESIGRLAGGVAHDLNNLLTPILGYGEILSTGFDVADMRKELAEQIVQAGLRARDLVRQLLAFSRKQVLEFKPVELNNVVANFGKLLKRTFRENIAVKFLPLLSAPLIRGDVGQLEQVIMNLAVNAQDAMPEGGVLTIETAAVELDQAYAAAHRGVTPGRYLMLAISDTGHGMDAEVQAHLFEPFFTTKEKDKGTGLGLATVYGIVKQHGGNIWVYSEPGKGTTFKVYLPVLETETAVVSRTTPTPSVKELRGVETILLAEDEPIVRQLAQTILQQQGYTVLAARSGQQALAMLADCQEPVHLLLTDVVMPEMNGRELFACIAAQYPDVKVLYMSGYTENVIVHHGVLDEGTHFIQKPFTAQDLAGKLREVFDG